ncbi:hypothetical protein LENED_012099 [Lentinula edodes]|uniref:Uncharacterized protein n=1 Tax=Lentinula edodes TaxID=5353 RepID=A0A1Q3ERP8_LENED|nr:hypothetical protein LENED_012099 [Lentinula edodes]
MWSICDITNALINLNQVQPRCNLSTDFQFLRFIPRHLQSTSQLRRITAAWHGLGLRWILRCFAIKAGPKLAWGEFLEFTGRLQVSQETAACRRWTRSVLIDSRRISLYGNQGHSHGFVFPAVKHSQGSTRFSSARSWLVVNEGAIYSAVAKSSEHHEAEGWPFQHARDLRFVDPLRDFVSMSNEISSVPSWFNRLISITMFELEPILHVHFDNIEHFIPSSEWYPDNSSEMKPY